MENKDLFKTLITHGDMSELSNKYNKNQDTYTASLKFEVQPVKIIDEVIGDNNDYHTREIREVPYEKAKELWYKYMNEPHCEIIEKKAFESSNKYVKSFREAVEKLEEDDGNPSLLQAINYDVDNDEIQKDNRFKDLKHTLFEVYEIADDLCRYDYKNNKKLKKVRDSLRDTWNYLNDEMGKDLDRNEFVNKPYYDDEPEYDLQNADYDY